MGKISTKDIKSEMAQINKPREITLFTKQDGTEVILNIKPHLSPNELIEFITYMAGANFTHNEYTPYSAKITFAVKLAEYYTNFPLPKDIIEAYKMVSTFNLVGIVRDCIGDTDQYRLLIESIKELLEYNIKQKTGINGLLDSVRNSLDDFDLNTAISQMKDFSPEQLEHFSSIKSLADAFNKIPQKESVVPENAETQQS